jgi:CDP-diacylglycerol---glycerol-3-phosphate 3-phosphatidyltransferase
VGVTEQDLGRGAAGRVDPGVPVPTGSARPAPPPASVWNVANALTAVRVLLVPIFGLLLLRGRGPDHHLPIAAAAVFVVAAFTDLLDGELARRHSLVTDVGKIADPIADKALVGTALVGLSLLGELPWWVTAIVLVREVGVTLLRIVVIRRRVLPAGRGGKAKTVVQALAITMYLLPLPVAGHDVAVSAMAGAVVLTVVTGVDYLLRATRQAPG